MDREDCALVVIARIKKWLQDAASSGQSVLPRTTKRLENGIRPLCRLNTLESLESVIGWLLQQGMLQIDENQAVSLSSLYTSPKSIHLESFRLPDEDEISILPEETKRKVERFWALAMASNSRPSSLRGLLAALAQVVSLRVDVPPERIVARLVEDGWLRVEHTEAKDTIVYSIPPVAPRSGQGANSHDVSDGELLGRLREWAETMRTKEEQEREGGISGGAKDQRRDWMRFEQALASLEEFVLGANVDRRRLATFLLGDVASSLVDVCWTTTPDGGRGRGGLFVSLPTPPPSVREYHTFDDMWDLGFDEVGRKGDTDMLRGVYTCGFEKPSTVQRQFITPIVNGWDVFFQSQPGTGKSVLLAIAVLQRVAALWTIEKEKEEEENEEETRKEEKEMGSSEEGKKEVLEEEEDGGRRRGAKTGGEGGRRGGGEWRRNPMALIIVPTRELAHQMQSVIDALGSFFFDNRFRPFVEARSPRQPPAAAEASVGEEEGDVSRRPDEGRWKRRGEAEDEDGDGDGERGEEEAHAEEEEEGGGGDDEERRQHKNARPRGAATRTFVPREPILCHALMGGIGVGREMGCLKRRPLIVIGSLGRVVDMVSRKNLYLKDLEMLVVDDASSFFDVDSHSSGSASLNAIDALCDEYLRGPRPQLVLSSTCNFGGGPAWIERRRRLWRRTVGEGVLIKTGTRNVDDGSMEVDRNEGGPPGPSLAGPSPYGRTKVEFFAFPSPDIFAGSSSGGRRNQERPLLKVTIPRDEWSLEGVKHFVIDVEREEWKFDVLCDLCDTISVTQCIVFVNTKRKADWLYDKLTQANFTFSCVHGDLTQDERDAVLREFRTGASRLLITNDLLACGIDVPAVSIVINYDLPPARETYIHRTGRCGRFGRKGIVINLATEVRELMDLAQFFGLLIDELPASFADLI